MGKLLCGLVLLLVVSFTRLSQLPPIPWVDLSITPSVIILEDIKVIPIKRISVYNPVPRQTDGDPFTSSCGPNLQNQIAVSRDLFFNAAGKKHLCGVTATVVTKEGLVYSDYVVWDTLSARYNNTVDVMLPHDDEDLAMQIGITEGTLLLRY